MREKVSPSRGVNQAKISTAQCLPPSYKQHTRQSAFFLFSCACVSLHRRRGRKFCMYETNIFKNKDNAILRHTRKFVHINLEYTVTLQEVNIQEKIRGNGENRSTCCFCDCGSMHPFIRMFCRGRVIS